MSVRPIMSGRVGEDIAAMVAWVVAYRTEPDAHERERARLAAHVRELESRWTPVFWSEVAPVRGVAPPSGSEDDPDALAVRARVLEALEADRSLILRDWTRAPIPLGGQRSVELDAIDLWEERPAVLGGARGLASSRQLFGLTSAAWPAAVARAVRDAAGDFEIDLRLDAQRTDVGAIAEVELACGAPIGLGELRVVPEGLLDDLRRMFGLQREIELGDPTFDGVFRVVGDRHAADHVLDARARRGLLTLGERGHVELCIGERAAIVRGLHVPEGEDLRAIPLRAALDVLRSVKAAPVRPLRT